MLSENIIVEIKDLKKSYFRKHALDGITLNIKKGHILGLLGPNGSGKSTLLKIITGLVRPSSGQVFINGSAPSYQTKAQVAYLPEVDHLYAWMSVREIIDFVAAFYQDWQPDRAAQMLEIMKLEPKQKVRTLSKGQRAQLKLLLTLSRKVPLVLLDEPLSGIDPPSRARIISSIVNEYRAGEQTIIISTHQVGETETIFDEVLFLREGQIALQDSAENLRQQHGVSIQDFWGRVYH